MNVRVRRLTASLLLALVLNLSATVLYVNVNSSNPMQPYTNWSIAATAIQDAIDVASPGDLIQVTNGVYGTGGRVVYGTLTNRVVLNKAVTVQSVNGPEVTIITGSQMAVNDGVARCAYLTNGAQLCGFTLTNGATHTAGLWDEEGNGAGLWCESQSAIVSNCVVVGNVAAIGGAGAASGRLYNCLLKNNSAYQDVGGGAIDCSLINCTLTDNLGYISGGGAANSSLTNCLLARNWGAQEGGAAFGSTLVNCVLTNNTAGNDGGGTAACVLNNCLVISNSASYSGGGANYAGTLCNCTLVGNSAPVRSKNANRAIHKDLQDKRKVACGLEP